MNIPTRDELKTLLEIQESPCISLFFPTYRAGTDVQQNHIRLVNQVKEVERRLLHSDADVRTREELPPHILTLLQPLYALMDDKEFWLHPSDGIALFRSPHSMHAYRLPLSVKEHVIIATRFFLKPLLPLINDASFYILALSQNDIRLFEATRYSIHLLELPDTVPDSLAQALKYEHPGENQPRYRSASSGATVGKGGRRAAIFYGQGVGIDDAKDDILRYFQQIDRGLHELFHDKQSPLILAGVEYLQPLYRKANTYPYLANQSIAGNPDQMSAEALHERAKAIIEPYLAQKRQEALTRYEELAQTEHVSNNVSEIVPAAYYGRVANLFVALDGDQWGTFNPTTYSIEIHQEAKPADDELIDLAAAQTLRHGGTVYTVEQSNMPDQALLAAVFRY